MNLQQVIKIMQTIDSGKFKVYFLITSVEVCTGLEYDSKIVL